jgi:transcriptional regulator with XRE-family HTH domain
MLRTPDLIDKHVGGRVRMRRLELDMSQQELGRSLGLTFQQVQKYEKGTNRIGASTLQRIGKTLRVPVSFLFTGAPGGFEGEAAETPDTLLELLGTREGQALVAAFSRITNVNLRRSFVNLLEQTSLAVGALPKPKKPRKKPK